MRATRFVVCLLVIACAVSAAAQQPGAGPRPGRGSGMSPTEIQKMFDGYLVMQVQGSLGLSDQQFAEVVPRLRGLQETRRRHQLERSRLLGELQRLTRPAVAAATDESAIRERIVNLQENDSRLAEEVRRAYALLDEVLDVRQQGRFRLLEEQLERKKLELLLRARQNSNRMLKRPPPGR